MDGVESLARAAWRERAARRRRCAPRARSRDPRSGCERAGLAGAVFVTRGEEVGAAGAGVRAGCCGLEVAGARAGGGVEVLPPPGAASGPDGAEFGAASGAGSLAPRAGGGSATIMIPSRPATRANAARLVGAAVRGAVRSGTEVVAGGRAVLTTLLGYGRAYKGEARRSPFGVSSSRDQDYPKRESCPPGGRRSFL